MCYSAQIHHQFRLFQRLYGAVLSIDDFIDIYWRRLSDSSIKIPKAMDGAFTDPQNDGERPVQSLIEAYAQQQAPLLEQELFKQRKRLADAERVLQVKATKAAVDSRRIATEKIEWLRVKLSDLRRDAFEDLDARIFPGHYAPLIVMEDGRRVVKPMRYQCRPAGKPADYDRKFPGTYNARRDNLEGFWGGLFGRTHGVLVVSRFFENVARRRADGTTENVVLEFSPDDGRDMFVVCLWSRWTADGEPDLLSFAAVTDEPPPEVMAAGHDRCVVAIKPENVDAWLQAGGQPKAMYEILADADRPYYANRIAA